MNYAVPPGMHMPISHPETALPQGVQKLQRPPALVKAQSLAFLMFVKPDLDATEKFLRDFGLRTVLRRDDVLHMRGHGQAPCIFVAVRGEQSRYTGAAFTVAGEAQLRTLEASAGARRLPPEQIPGGGSGVELIDPAGNLVWVVCDQRKAPPLPLRVPVSDLANCYHVTRRVNATVRAPVEPAAVARLGHVVLQTVDFAGMADWYMRHLGLIPTDVQYLADGSPNLCFLRLNLGETPADHHSFVLAGGIEDRYEHSAYEVVDLDALGQGQNVLKANGHRHMWGIGRHILGSQLFDYWHDPEGMEFEHYTDGDVFTASHPTHYLPLELSGIWAWGDDVPASMGAKRDLGTVLTVVKLLWRRRISLGRLKLLGAAMSRPRPWL